MRRIILIALGGGLGSIARFSIVLWLKPFHFWEPISILLINFSGSFLIAVVNFLSEPIGPVARLRLGILSREFLMVGICGGFTTFSTFCYMVYMATVHWTWADALLNIFLSHALCITAVGLGFLFSRAIEQRFQPDAPTEEAEGEQILSEEESA
jgi:fluoride exporter